MGRDKALLPHPEGGCWLERSLQLLAGLQAPITLLSRWPDHLERAKALQLPQLEAISEPAPWEGPLLALHRLMQRHPEQRLLLCPVDMPALTLSSLQALVGAGADEPDTIQLAHDGERLQPLLGVYPSTTARRRDLTEAIAQGQRRLQGWLAQQPCRSVALDPASIRNVNRASEL